MATAVGVRVEAVALDFETKVVSEVDLPGAVEARTGGRFVWIDLDHQDATRAREVLESLGWIDEQVLEDIFESDPGTQLSRYPDLLHLVLTGCRIDAHDGLDLERVDAVFGENFLITVHAGPRLFLDAVRREYRADFERFARTPSFLLYELWDHLCENYVAIQKRLEQRIDRVQAALLVEGGEEVFATVSEAGADLLHFRSVLMPARLVLTELSTRRSIFVSEATQPFLANLVGTLERVLQDVLVDRDILAQSLSLHMSMISHRTNRAMSKLTVISVIFLPLTFLCGVYGMNFQVLPETQWRYGYAFFWLLTFSIAISLVLVMRKNRLL